MTGFVYFIGPEALYHRSDIQFVKIGFTKNNPDARLRSLQCGSPVVLNVHAYFEGSEALERAFHEAFAELRSHGEWFFLERKLFDFLHYFYDPPRSYVTQERLQASIYDNIFARCSSHPSMTDEEYLGSCEPGPIRRHFPKLWHEHCADHLAVVQ